MAAIDHRARWQIADVLDRTDLAALLDELTVPSTQLGPGRRWHCPMPEHDDHRASVTMHSDRRGHERWRCWSGDHRGDAIDLVTAVSNRNRSEAIDWLFTDIHLPGLIDGWTVAAAYRERHPHRPIIYASTSARTERRTVSGSIYVRKPFEPREILALATMMAASNGAEDALQVAG